MARILVNDDNQTDELYIDGEFVAAWNNMKLTNLQNGIVCSMIERAVEYGEQKKAREIRRVIGAK